jgi:hypothetical protein
MTARTLHLPWRSFYWAVVSGDSATRTVPGTAVYDELERVLPVPLEDVEVRQVRSPSGAVIACGLERNRLVNLIERHPECVAIVPAELPLAVCEAAGFTTVPSAASASGFEPAGLNFLTMEFEPEIVTRLRRVQRRTWLAASAVVCALVAAGFWSRAHAATESARDVRQATRTLVLGAATRGNQVSTEDARRTLQAERAVLVQSRGEAGNSLRPTDAADGLAAILAAWPEAETRVSSLQVTPSHASLGVELPSTAGAEAFATSLARASGWRMLPPQSDAAGAAIRVTVRLERLVGEAKGGTP